MNFFEFDTASPLNRLTLNKAPSAAKDCAKARQSDILPALCAYGVGVWLRTTKFFKWPTR
jgi:hypothetical protein